MQIDVEVGFAPEVLSVVSEKDLSNGGMTKWKYELTVHTFSGKTGNSIYVDSLRNISWFELFGCPDAHLSRQQRAMFEYDMQKQAGSIVPKEKLLCQQGLQFYNGDIPIFVCGDKIFTPEEELLEKCCIKQGCRYRLKDKKTAVKYMEKEVCQAKEYILLLPEVTPILFYGALLSVLKPILANLGENADFVMAVIGSKGHLKTSMVKMYALWLEDDVQKIDFMSGVKKQDIERRISELSGQNVLLDDLHEMKAGYNRNRMGDRLDMVTRLISNNISCTNVFITGESIRELAIGSTRDRMLQVSVPKMDGKHLAELKKNKDNLSDNFMAKLAALFAKKIISNYNAVVKDIESFLAQYQPPEYLDGSTRIPAHIKFIQLTEFLYRKYLCTPDQDLSCKELLYHALEKQAKIQEKELLEQEAEAEEDYVVGFYNMLKENEFDIETDEDAYSPDSGAVLCFDNKIYIRGQVLQEALFKHYKWIVLYTTVASALHNAGILEEDKDVKTKKFMHRRHYVVSYPMLKKYCEIKGKL